MNKVEFNIASFTAFKDSYKKEVIQNNIGKTKYEIDVILEEMFIIYINRELGVNVSTLKEAVNKRMATYNKKYHVANKEKIATQMKEYYVANKEKITAQRKEYYVDNKEKINSKRRERYLKRKEENKDE